MMKFIVEYAAERGVTKASDWRGVPFTGSIEVDAENEADARQRAIEAVYAAHEESENIGHVRPHGRVVQS